MENQKSRGQIFLFMLTHPIFLLAWFLFFRYTYKLCQFGGVRRNLPVIAVCGIFFLFWLILFLIKILAHRDRFRFSPEERWRPGTIYQAWRICAVIILVGTAGYFGAKIVHSAIPYNGKLSWFLQDLETKRTAEFKSDKLYEDGIDGILKDVREEVELPDKLYLNSSLELKFKADGTITYFDMNVSGQLENGERKTYLIYCHGGGDISIISQDGPKSPYKATKSLDPLRSTIKTIPIKKNIEVWQTCGFREFGILYQGIRSWGYNTDGIYYIDPSGNLMSAETMIPKEEIVNFTISLYLPGQKEGSPLSQKGSKSLRYCPYRYIPVQNLKNAGESNKAAAAELKKENPVKEETIEPGSFKMEEDGSCVFYLTDKTAYRLVVVDAAAGSRFYALEKTKDGTNWKRINEDPYNGNIGGVSGLTFLNEKLGFIALSHNGGSEGELYRTEDGGKTFTQVKFPERKAKLPGGEEYNPFDTPEMPYEEGKVLKIKIGQGADGDYNSGSKAVYTSKDSGKTWRFAKESPKTEQ